MKVWWNTKNREEKDAFISWATIGGTVVAVGAAVYLIKKHRASEAVETVTGSFTRSLAPVDKPYNVLITKVCDDNKVHAIASTRGLADKAAVIEAMKGLVEHEEIQDYIWRNVAGK